MMYLLSQFFHCSLSHFTCIKPFSISTNLKNILAQVFFMNKLKYRWVETNLLLQHIVTETAKMAIVRYDHTNFNKSTP